MMGAEQLEQEDNALPDLSRTPTATRVGLSAAILGVAVALVAASNPIAAARRRDYEEMIDMADEAL